MLVEDTLFGRVNKVAIAIERLKTFEPPEGYYLAFSGGKDSQCIYHLAEMAGVKFDAHYNVTTIDHPELIYFIRKNYPTVQWNRPKIPLLKLIETKGFPTSANRWCCDLYKERGGDGRRVVTGVRKEESRKRSSRKMVEQCFKNKSKTYINPIIDWNEDDVWEFIMELSLPYCELYDPPHSFTRLGCIMCPSASLQIRKLHSIWYPRFVTAYRKSFIKLFNNNHRESMNRWRCGEDMFHWWLFEMTPDNPDQTVMFE